jgi:hypothetical protein
MLESLGLTDDENVLEMNLLLVRSGRQCRLCCRILRNGSSACDQRKTTEDKNESNLAQAISQSELRSKMPPRNVEGGIEQHVARKGNTTGLR